MEACQKAGIARSTGQKYLKSEKHAIKLPLRGLSEQPEDVNDF